MRVFGVSVLGFSGFGCWDCRGFGLSVFGVPVLEVHGQDHGAARAALRGAPLSPAFSIKVWGFGFIETGFGLGDGDVTHACMC